MEHLPLILQQTFMGGVINFVVNGIRVPYFPTGRDNTERNLKTFLHESSEFAFLVHCTSLLLCLQFFHARSSPYHFDEKLVMLDWICTILIIISVTLFVRNLYVIRRYGRHRGYSIHLPNTIVSIFLHFGFALAGGLYYVYLSGEAEIKKYFVAIGMIENIFIAGVCVGIFSLTVRLRWQLKLYQQMLNTIDPLPYKPKGA